MEWYFHMICCSIRLPVLTLFSSLFIYILHMTLWTIFTLWLSYFPFFRFVMDELELPSRLFETGCKPSGKKRVNNYFNLRWIEVIKSALDDEDLTMLSASQFGQVLKMESHTFSVCFFITFFHDNWSMRRTSNFGGFSWGNQFGMLFKTLHL